MQAEPPPPPETSPAGSEDKQHPKPTRLKLTIAVIPLVLTFGVGSIVLSVFRPYLINEHPLLLMIVSPTAPFMLLVQAKLDAASFYLSVIPRRLFADPSLYFLGLWYGDRAIEYMKRYSKDLGDLAVKLEEWFPKFGPWLVLFYPHTLVMVLAGASRMSFKKFITLDLIGTLLVAITVRTFGDVLKPIVDPILEFNNQWWIPLTILGVVIVAFQIWSGHRDGKDGALPTTKNLRRQFEDDDNDGRRADQDWRLDGEDRRDS